VTRAARERDEGDARSRVPSLVGVVHLEPLPGSPRYGGDVERVVAAAARDGALLQAAGFDAAIVENFGDAPFEPGRVEPVCVATMTRCALAVTRAAPKLRLGINVLRNDAEAALAIAVACDADMIRINIHSGARITDQGVIEGQAHRTLRQRRALGAERLLLLCDVAVKHSAPLGERSIRDEAVEVVERGLADAVLVTGRATAHAPDDDEVRAVADAVKAPVLVASGITPDNLPLLERAHGVIVGSWLMKDGRAGGPVDADRATRFADAFRSRR
jgi:hypothetical protein